MKIDFVGWYFCNNCGDDSFEIIFRKEFSSHDLNFVRPPFHPRKDCDLIILGGGAVVSPFYLNVIPYNKPLYALGVDIAYESEIDLLLKRPFLEVCIRNKKDLPELKRRLSCKVSSAPDLAFSFCPTGNDILSGIKKYPKKKSIGVFVTDYVNPAIDRPIEKFSDRSNDFKIKLALKLDELEEEGYEIILIPFSTGGYGDDRRINLDLAAFMESRPTNILNSINPQDMIDLISQLDLAICMRFHAHVFSLIGGIPFVSIDFTRKVDLLLKELNLFNLSAARFNDSEFDVGDFNIIVENAIKNKNLFNKKYSESCRQEITNLFSRVRQDWIAE